MSENERLYLTNQRWWNN